MINDYIIVIITIFFCAFFAGIEIAFLSSNKLQIELEKSQHKFSSRIISRFVANPTQFIATMLIGNNISLVIYGIATTHILEPQIRVFVQMPFVVFLIQVIVSTLVILITAEFLPKVVFRISPNFMLNFFAIPIAISYYLLFPITKLVMFFTNNILKNFFKVEIGKGQQKMVFGKVDLDAYINEFTEYHDEPKEAEAEIKLFRNALDFSEVRLRECMVPRTEIIALDVNESIEVLKNKFIETGLSKIIIYEKNIENIVGYVHSLALFKNPNNIKSMLIEIPIVPETMPANKLLNNFICEQKSIAVVVDEFGGVSGIITVEDIIEEIFGEIEDEYDQTNRIEKQISSNEFIFSGRIEIDYLNEKYALNIPDSNEYETLAGYILFHHGNIPKINETIVIGDYIFKIIKVSNTRIEMVNLKTITK